MGAELRVRQEGVATLRHDRKPPGRELQSIPAFVDDPMLDRDSRACFGQGDGHFSAHLCRFPIKLETRTVKSFSLRKSAGRVVEGTAETILFPEILRSRPEPVRLADLPFFLIGLASLIVRQLEHASSVSGTIRDDPGTDPDGDDDFGETISRVSKFFPNQQRTNISGHTKELLGVIPWFAIRNRLLTADPQNSVVVGFASTTFAVPTGGCSTQGSEDEADQNRLYHFEKSLRQRS